MTYLDKIHIAYKTITFYFIFLNRKSLGQAHWGCFFEYLSIKRPKSSLQVHYLEVGSIFELEMLYITDVHKYYFRTRNFTLSSGSFSSGSFAAFSFLLASPSSSCATCFSDSASFSVSVTGSSVSLFSGAE